jgi:predicted DNA-binding transcriptional regulator AlpA
MSRRPGKEPAQPETPPPGARYISAPQLLSRYGGRSHMWLVRRLERDPSFPRPIKFGRLRFFEIAAIERWERECAAGGNQGSLGLHE